MKLVNILLLLLLGRKKPTSVLRGAFLWRTEQRWSSFSVLTSTHPSGFHWRESLKKPARRVISYLPEVFSLECFSYLSITTESLCLSRTIPSLCWALACCCAKPKPNSKWPEKQQCISKKELKCCKAFARNANYKWKRRDAVSKSLLPPNSNSKKNFEWLQEFTVVPLRQKWDFKSGVASLSLCQQEPVGDPNAPM